MPKVSVLLPTYNTNPEHLREAIESILNQMFTDFELLILDDCSTKTPVEDTVRSYSDDRIKFHKNEVNLGISGTRNKLISLARGEYLATFDHDDISLPERLEKQVAFLDKNPEVGVLGSAVEEFPKQKIMRPALDNESIENNLMFECAIIHSSSMVRKNVLEESGIYYEENFSPAEDYRLWTRLIGKTRFANLQDVLLRYRSHSGNTTHSQLDKIRSAIWVTGRLARATHPEIRARVELRSVVVTKYRFLGQTLLSVHKRAWRKKYLLFGKIPVLKARSTISIE